MAGKKKTRSRPPRKPARRSRPSRPAKPAVRKRRRTTRAKKAPVRPARASKSTPVPRRRHEAVEVLERRIRRLRSSCARLERRLTEAVQEIGTLRRFELRARELEGELEKREEDLAAARRELALLLPGAAAARP